MQDAGGVGADLDAGADLAEHRRLLVDTDVEPGAQQRQCGGETADAAADHTDRNTIARHIGCPRHVHTSVIAFPSPAVAQRDTRCCPRNGPSVDIGGAGVTHPRDDATSGAAVPTVFGMDAVEVEGLQVGYERVGTGPAVVFLHGYVGDGPATWQYQLDDLADGFTVVAWDAPGAGRSADPPESFGLAGYADCLAGFIAALGLDRPHVVGLSFGGTLALELAHRHPTSPRSLVIVSGYAG